jgi:DNA-directed RNA polymerase subunit M/transcription elongation factor TFIIS
MIACPRCGARFAVPTSLAGRRARCDACNEPFAVPALDTSTELTLPAKEASTQITVSKKVTKPASPASSVQLTGFECRVCGTRLYGPADKVGKKVKCPDCGAGTAIPEPPKPKTKNMPAALEGEQYELWDVDEQPLPSELVAAQPRYINIPCRKCGSLITATVNQVGQQVACHDCGTTQIVPKPSLPAKKVSVLASDSQTPKLDPDAHPGERPFVMTTANRLTLSEERQEAEYVAAAQKSRQTGRRMAVDTRGRPVLPPYPLLTGVVEFPFTSGVPTRWIVLTLCFVLWGALMIDGLKGWVTWSRPNGGGEAVFAALAETFMAAPLAVVWYASLSSIVIAIFSQSAVGARHVDDWPSLNFIHSMSEMLPLGIAITFCMAPGWGIGHLFADELWQELAAGGVTLILGLPSVMLSQLAGNSTWELIDLKVVGAAVRCPFSMLLFYLESATLLVVCAAAIFFVGQKNIYFILFTAPLIVGCAIVYARLLGRLGWRLSEKMDADEPDEDDSRPVGPKNYNPPRFAKPTN